MTSRGWIVGALLGGGLIAAGVFLLLRDASSLRRATSRRL